MKIFRTWRMGVLSFICSWSKRAHDQASGNSITVVLTQYHVKTSFQDRFLEALSGYVFSSINATGNIMAEAYYEKGDVSVIWTIERWSNRASYINNRKTTAAKEVSVLRKNGLVSPVETIFMKDLLFFSKETTRNMPKAYGQPITVMLFIEVKAGVENYFNSINEVIFSVFLNEPGVLIFQFSRVLYCKTRFIVFKKFRDWDAFRYHLENPALKPVIKFLQTSIKEPPFEKGYHLLIQFAPAYIDC